MKEADRDYYNDLPGKVPPDIGPPPVPPLPVCSSTLPNLKHHSSSSNSATASSSSQSTVSDPVGKSGKSAQKWSGTIETGNLIDLSSDSSAPSSANAEHNYVNDTVIAASRDSRREPATFFDAFDMRKFLLIQTMF